MILSGPENQTVTTVGGKYSLYRLATSGPYTVTPSAPGYTFSPPSQTFTTVIGGQTASFAGAANADLSVSQTSNPNGIVGLGQNLTYQIIAANGRPRLATNVTLTDMLPFGASFVSVTTDTGTCTGTPTITCNIGALPRSGMATVTVLVRTIAPGWFGGQWGAGGLPVQRPDAELGSDLGKPRSAQGRCRRCSLGTRRR